MKRRDTPFIGKSSILVAVLLTGGILAFAFALAKPASADLLLPTSQGSGAGQIDSARAIAVDRSSGELYVADTGNNRVSVFEADGDFIRAFGWDVIPTGQPSDTGAGLETCTEATTCQAGSAGSGAGQFSDSDLGRDSIAIDNDPTSLTYRDVFVGTSRVQRFTSAGSFLFVFNSGISGGRMTVGPGGDVYVADTPNHLRRLSSSGALLAKLTLPPAELNGVNGIAVDSAGNFYLASGFGTGAVRKYDPAGNLLHTVNPSLNILAIATDAADNLLVTDVIGIRGISQYAPSGEQLRVFYGEAERRLISIAPYTNATGDVFGLEEKTIIDFGRIAHISYPLPGPLVLPHVGATKATAVGNTKATVNTLINPEGSATTFHIEYVDQVAYDANGFVGALSTPEAPIGSDFALHSPSALIGCSSPATELEEPGNDCLTPATTYYYRVVASNLDGISTGPEGIPFTTKESLEISDAWATSVNTADATLHAEVNPLSIPATGYFQYVPEEICQADLKALGPGHCFDKAASEPSPTEPIDFGFGEVSKIMSVQITSLTPGTTYRYRLLGTNAFDSVAGPERTIVTYALPEEPFTACPNQAFRSAASAPLPDCRAYEMVSPVEKNGGDIFPLFRANLDQSATDGQSITYSSYRAFGDAQSAPVTIQYLAHRDALGWKSESLATPRQGHTFYGQLPGDTSFLLQGQYRRFSEDLCQALVVTDTEPLLAPKALAGYPNIYRRDNCGPDAGIYESLTTSIPKSINPGQFSPTPRDLTPTGSHAIFTTEGALTPDGVTCAKGADCTRQLYLAQAGKLRLLCILPDGTATTAPCSAGLIRAATGSNHRIDDARHAISADGSRVYWTRTGPSGNGVGELYVRVNADQGQSKLVAGKCSEAVKACTYPVSVGAGAHFRAASADGSSAVYTQAQNLYRFELGKAVAGEPAASTLLAKEVNNVLGASEDASRVYFVSRKVLVEATNGEGDKAAGGQPNLYLHEAGAGGGSFAFIGTLSIEDKAADIEQNPTNRLSRITPDGTHLAFVSVAPLTGYDNTDAASGEADKEVFLYDAGGAELRCVSCNPSGARPAGGNPGGVVLPDWTAATLPGWLHGVYFSRVLSDDGERLFFESYDPLVLRDTNGAIDVYEWSGADDEADCDQAGADLYSPEAGGCISLISSGRSPQDSFFVDASNDGSDVFFKTQSSLLPQDDGLIDIYDARVEGGFAPVLPPPPTCEGEACQGTPDAPEDPTPASAAFEGAGNLQEAPTKQICRRPKVRRRGRCVNRRPKRARQHKTRGREHRANHERRTVR